MANEMTESQKRVMFYADVKNPVEELPEMKGEDLTEDAIGNYFNKALDMVKRKSGAVSAQYIYGMIAELLEEIGCE